MILILRLILLNTIPLVRSCKKMADLWDFAPAKDKLVDCLLLSAAGAFEQGFQITLLLYSNFLAVFRHSNISNTTFLSYAGELTTTVVNIFSSISSFLSHCFGTARKYHEARVPMRFRSVCSGVRPGGKSRRYAILL